MRRKKPIEFHKLWSKMEGICRAKAMQALSHADAQDLVSEYSFSVWSILQTPKFMNMSNEHAKAYLLKIFKYRIIDAIRKRKRMNELMDGYGQLQPQCHWDDSDKIITLKELVGRATLISPTHGKVMELMIQGFSYREIAKQLGYGSSQIARYARDGMARLSSDERVLDERVAKSNTNEKEANMAKTKVKLAFKQVGNVIKVIKDKKVLALVTVSDDNDAVEAIEVRKGASLSQNVITSAVYQHLGIKSTAKASKEEEPEVEAPAKKTVKKTAPVKKADPMLMPIDGLDLGTLKDVPATLKGWQKKCGGEGYCLGGSGFPVGRRFKPGYDAKLKSALKRIGTANAKALAKELGWDKMIKWNA